jgi:Raf kinase inhibitor-like YbhB/YbcL family protein
MSARRDCSFHAEDTTMRRHVFVIAAALLLSLFCSARRKEAAATATSPQAPSPGMQVASSAFPAGGTIPAKYGCSGSNTSPPLSFQGVPPAAKTLALIVEDPDAPAGLFTHWVVWNIPPGTVAVAEGTPPVGATEGKNSYGKSGWGPPCPPSGEHRYMFNLYALDSALNLPSSSGREQLQDGMAGHVLAQSQLLGRYRR